MKRYSKQKVDGGFIYFYQGIAPDGTKCMMYVKSYRQRRTGEFEDKNRQQLVFELLKIRENIRQKITQYTQKLSST